MGEFFKGWRRKAGLVTLAMACLLFVAWMRSLTTKDDCFAFSRTEWILSGDGYLTVVLMERGGHFSDWQATQNGPVAYRMGRCWSNTWRWTVAGARFGFDTYGDAKMEVDKAWWCRLPFWEIILPLTLLSAWLILGKTKEVKPAADLRLPAPDESIQ